MSQKANPARIGAFVVGAVVLGAVGLVAFGSGKFFDNSQKFVCYFENSVNGLTVGAPVKFKGVPVGQVSEIRLRFGKAENSADIPVIISINQDVITDALGVKIDFEDSKILDAMVRAGFRAKLESQSMVTGLLFVGLDYYPGTALRLVGTGEKTAEIPTLPSTLQEFQQALTHVLGQFQKVNFQQILENLQNTSAGLDRLVNSPKVDQTLAALEETIISLRDASRTIDQKVGPIAEDIHQVAIDAKQALAKLNDVLEEANQLVSPDSPVIWELAQALKQASAAASSVDGLAGYLQANPRALLFGREGD